MGLRAKIARMKASKIEAADVTLAPYYLVGIVATTIGILIVVILNFFTPLNSIQSRFIEHGQFLSWNVLLTFFLPRLLFVLGLSYAFVVFGIWQMLKPISGCLELYRKGIVPDAGKVRAAQRRILNLHFFFVPVNVLMWILIPGIIGLSSALADITDHRTVIILAARASMIGLIASAIASQRIESISRYQLIPFFFPEGRLSDLAGASRISISKRIILVNRLGSVVPVLILLVTLLTLQWELETSPATSVITYGRSILTFTFVLFVWTLIFSRELNRLLSHNIVDPINDLVRVLSRIQHGKYDGRVRIVSNDEIGYAGDVVNEMTQGLLEREEMQQHLDLAREIQQNLLPRHNPRIPGLDIAGTSIYCDETGGDFYDYLPPESGGTDRIRIVLGDVSGHGVSSALLMATARALFRQRSSLDGNLADVTADVNRHLCRDVEDTGNFMTLFCVELEPSRKTLKWVRAGHDPAALFVPREQTFHDLMGEGIALGLDKEFTYEENIISDVGQGHILALFTDGIWEAENPSEERFGKSRLFDLIRENAGLSAQKILDTVMGEVNRFQEKGRHRDDATLIIVKVGNG